ncbi:hypothetical protein EZV62_019432 [Acer yangbiense]|uniref:Secreted protein n=1 Tax=Acer yangbiense TaxID=1000413 RepID=A0A5C7HD93_9ROSI|nr:hypothetical protein EZV62_019432 [Acer yangbiense]
MQVCSFILMLLWNDQTLRQQHTPHAVTPTGHTNTPLTTPSLHVVAYYSSSISHLRRSISHLLDFAPEK